MAALASGMEGLALLARVSRKGRPIAGIRGLPR